MTTPQENQKLAHEEQKDWTKLGWKHPYMIYIALVVLLFGFLGLMGYLAVQNEWIPSRGVS